MAQHVHLFSSRELQLMQPRRTLMETNVMTKAMWNGEGQRLLSTDLLPAHRHRRAWLNHLESVSADEIASHDDAATLRCEEWEARSQLDDALYENAYSSCDTIEVLSATWLPKR
jgi:hypothetical protein